MKKYEFYTSKELKPTGWLRRQLRIQANGLSGNLHKIWPDIRDSAWIGGDREGWERVPYWLDGFIPLAYLLEDRELIAAAKKYVDAILARQDEDGWICPCDKEGRRNYDTWAVQLITKVLTVYYGCSGDERIPDVLYRVLKNYYELLKSGEIKLFSWGKFRWFECFIAVNFIYERYGEEWLKELASILRRQGADYSGFTELWKTPLNVWRFETHIVNIGMMLKSEAVSCDILGEEYAGKADKLFETLDRYNGTAVGTFTGDECLAGKGAIHGTELCSVAELMYSYELLYAYTGESKWAELLELAAFNALPATISEDMWTHQYDQMSNQIACVDFCGKAIYRTNGAQCGMFGLEPGFGCCTANFNQAWPKFALSSFMHSGNTVISAVILPSELRTKGLYIKSDTDYPFENSVKYRIESDKDICFKVRVPSFARYVRVNGKDAAGGVLSFDIKAGEKADISISFDTEPRFVHRPYGLNAVKCGSLVFSVPIRYEKKMHEYTRDNVERKFPYCDYEYIPLSEWNFGFSSDELSVVRRGPKEIPFCESEPPVTVRTSLKRIDWGFEDGYDNVCAKVPGSTAPLSEDIETDLYPYGCAKLRMTELPFVK